MRAFKWTDRHPYCDTIQLSVHYTTFSWSIQCSLSFSFGIPVLSLNNRVPYSSILCEAVYTISRTDEGSIVSSYREPDLR